MWVSLCPVHFKQRYHRADDMFCSTEKNALKCAAKACRQWAVYELYINLAKKVRRMLGKKSAH